MLIKKPPKRFHRSRRDRRLKIRRLAQNSLAQNSPAQKSLARTGGGGKDERMSSGGCTDVSVVL
jgi:hypothetical protein